MPAQVMKREGIFLLLKACQPTWKLAVLDLIAIKKANFEKVFVHVYTHLGSILACT